MADSQAPSVSAGASRRWSFLWRVMAVAFVATHVPLVTLAISLALWPQPSRLSMVALVLVATLLGTTVLLLVLTKWLGPLQTATDRLHHFLASGELQVGGPYPDNELGTLLEDIDLVSARLAAQRDAARADAAVDPVSGASSRRASEAFLDQVGPVAEGDGEAVSVVVVDLDDFKGVNDRQGHPYGDRVLQVVASTLRELPGVEHVGRWGGDEFLAVLRADPDAAVRAADRARALIADRTAASGERVTNSAGGAPLTAGVSPSAVVATADAAAYAAKRAGRDRVVVAVPKLTVTTDATEATESARPAT